MTKFAEIKWTISRGRDTYGYNICSLYVGGQKVASANGGGYDMVGTVWANWIEKYHTSKLWRFVALLKRDGKIAADGSVADYYGMRVAMDRITLDGACGEDSIRKIADVIGISWQSIPANRRSKNVVQYLVTLPD